MDVIEAFYAEVMQEADKKLALILERLYHRITQPPDNECIKHSLLQVRYANASIQLTRAKRRGSGNDQELACQKKERAKHEYYQAVCTCPIDPDGICVCCNASYDTLNSCRHPPHLSIKQQSEKYNARRKQDSGSYYYDAAYGKILGGE